MTGAQQRAALQNQIWKIANDVRGAVDGWDFKQYVLGTLFYRFISENFIAYITGGDASVDYAAMTDDDESIEAAKDDAIKTKGYFIYPSQLFVNVAAKANTNERLNTDLANIFKAIEASASGYHSEQDIRGLFADFDTTSNRLGNTVKEKNTRLAAVLKGVAALDFGGFDASHIDLFGDAYEFLISNYAATAGKSGGEFFTPQQVSKLIAQLAMHGQSSINKIYDPACGSGSLLLQAKKQFDNHVIEDGFFGQEINHTTYNLARMNMFLHNINYDKFHIQLGNTLIEPHFGDDKPFDAIVSNPPYSVKWIGSDDPTLINDDRFAPAGVLAPKSKADFAFVLHALSYLSSKGRAAIVCFPGIFYRGGAEQKIRQYLVDNNYVESVISLAPNLFYGTTIAVNILVLAKNKKDTTTQFIDASGLFKKETNNNALLDSHIKQIMMVFESKANVEHFAKSVPLEQVAVNEYNLTVSSYVAPEDKRKSIDIDSLNSGLDTTVTRINQLRSEIDAIVAKIATKGMSGSSFMETMLDGIEVEWRALGTLGELVRGSGLQKKDFTETGVPAIHYGQIYTHYGLSTTKTKSFVSPALAKQLRKVDKGDVVITNTSENLEDVGKALVYLGEIQAVTGGHATVLRPGACLLGKYFAYFTQTDEFASQKRKFAKGTKVIDVSATDMAKIKVPLPCPNDPGESLRVQAEIVKILDAFNELSAELSAELIARNTQYEYYRHYLLNFPKPESAGA
ncbi:type I restriction-modification system subunit M [Xanthomonas axonopodis pv. fascicularis]|uniref:type I restriction-modification system subunit M n=1 Tax=Xanthomonas axonopodis TaxID=53413 RepID=UPI0035315B19